MINVTVFSSSNVSIETEEFHIESQDDMIRFLKTLLDKIHYGGERICLEKATINEPTGGNTPSVSFEEIDRWS